MAIRRKYIRELAESILDQHRVKKGRVDVEEIARKMGIEVRSEGVDPDLSGFLFRDASTKKAIIGVNGAHHSNRQRFTMAHELGHYLLHAGEPVHVDGANVAYRINRRDETSAMGNDDSEREANLFAAELLMPARFLARDVAAVKDSDLLDPDNLVSKLATEYGVSAQALTFRLQNLGLIGENG